MEQSKLIANYMEFYYGGRIPDTMSELRKNDDMMGVLHKLSEHIEGNLPDNVKFTKSYFDDSVEKSNALTEQPQKRIKQTIIQVPDKETFSRKAVFEFDLTLEQFVKGNIETVTGKESMTIDIPQLIDKSNYYIRGNKYTAPLQIIDAITYAGKSDLLILKTMTRPIHLVRKSITIKDIFGTPTLTHHFTINVSTNTFVPFLLYYFCEFGFHQTLAFFGAQHFVKLFRDVDVKNITPEDNEKHIYFKYGKTLSLQVNRKLFDESLFLRRFVASLIAVYSKVKTKMDEEYLVDKEKLFTTLGSYISQSNPYDKGKGLLFTLKSSLDLLTKDVIKRHVEYGDSRNESIFTVLRWMVKDYIQLTSVPVTDLSSKRIRLGEYLRVPISFNIKDRMYRFKNKPIKYKTVKHLKDIFKVHDQILVNSLIGKNANPKAKINVIKYNDSVNDNGLYNNEGKITLAGPESPSSSSKHISEVNRWFDTSSMGIQSVITVSSTDPGMQSMLTGHFIDVENKRFKKTPLQMDNEELKEYDMQEKKVNRLYTPVADYSKK